MSSVSEPAYRQRTGQMSAEDQMRPQRQGGGRIHLLIAVLGMVSLGYMVWTIARMLGVLEG